MHRIAMLKPVSAVLAIALHRIDLLVLRVSRGRHTLAELFLPMAQVTTVGAKSGEPRAMPLACVVDGENLVLIASNFGQKNNPGWYYNLKANPRCTVTRNGVTREYAARETEGEERERYWQRAVSIYMGYDVYRVRASHRRIPVMLLEPVN